MSRNEQYMPSKSEKSEGLNVHLSIYYNNYCFEIEDLQMDIALLRI